MPELPEVEIQLRTLARWLDGCRFKQVRVHNPALRWPVQPEVATRLPGQRCQQFRRRGKVLLIGLDSGDTLVSHLGMSGRFEVDTPTADDTRHRHVCFEMDTGRRVYYRDPRRFGGIWLHKRGAPPHFLIARLGREPLALHGHEALDAATLYDQLHHRTRSMKSALMSGDIVAGIGNIYASEALHRAGIAPQTPACRLGRRQVARLLDSLCTVLRDAIDAGGSSIKDFADANGATGYFQHEFQVYGRTGAPCHKCGAPIANIKIAGRASFYCPVCQPPPP